MVYWTFKQNQSGSVKNVHREKSVPRRVGGVSLSGYDWNAPSVIITCIREGNWRKTAVCPETGSKCTASGQEEYARKCTSEGVPTGNSRLLWTVQVMLPEILYGQWRVIGWQRGDDGKFVAGDSPSAYASRTTIFLQLFWPALSGKNSWIWMTVVCTAGMCSSRQTMGELKYCEKTWGTACSATPSVTLDRVALISSYMKTSSRTLS